MKDSLPKARKVQERAKRLWQGIGPIRETRRTEPEEDRNSEVHGLVGRAP